jgi:anti-sigma factor ChrR (cupin superfamily)
MASLNADFSVRVAVDTMRMDWTPSPGGEVLRKRVYLYGPPEAGQVTSVVRYEPGSQFPAHEHPGGEEILVLDGVFSDEHGDWPAGTYLLNPEGFRHAPYSRPGCTLFVKLRQYPGAGRIHVAEPTAEQPWQPGAYPGTQIKPLYAQDGFDETMRLERWPPGVRPGRIDYPDGAELFVLDGAFEEEESRFGTGTWLRLPPGSAHSPVAPSGCILYIREGGFAQARASGA